MQDQHEPRALWLDEARLDLPQLVGLQGIRDKRAWTEIYWCQLFETGRGLQTAALFSQLKLPHRP